MSDNATLLEPVDDVMKRFTDKYCQVNAVWICRGKVKGSGPSVPTRAGMKYMDPCGRVSALTENPGLDADGLYPVKAAVRTLPHGDPVQPRCGDVISDGALRFISMRDFKVCGGAEPRKVAALPASPEIAGRLHNRGTMPIMLAKLKNRQSINHVIAWADDEPEGFAR